MNYLQLLIFENYAFTKMTKDHFVNYKEDNRTQNGVYIFFTPLTIAVNFGRFRVAPSVQKLGINTCIITLASLL